MNAPEPRPARVQPLQLCSMPEPLQARLDAMSPHCRAAAFRVAVAGDRETRQRIWLEVPMRWRDDVAAAIGLMLGAVLGTLKPWAKVQAAIGDVPADFRADVEYQARIVYELNLPRPKAPPAPERD